MSKCFKIGRRKLTKVAIATIVLIYFLFKLYIHFYTFSARSFNIPTNWKYLPLLVDTPGCQIPDLPLYDEEVTKVVSQDWGPTHICLRRGQWSTLESPGRRLKLDPLWPHFILKCGYKVITRGGSSNKRDWEVTVSELTDIPQDKWKQGIEITAEFIEVNCRFWSVVVKKEFHAIPDSNNRDKKDKIETKIEYWKGKELPPNIILFGQDSTTRLNFRRFGKQMLQFLEGSGAHEMKGYVKAGFNTFTNFVPLLSGYSLNDYRKACAKDLKTMYQDDCPLIFKELDDLNYLTAFAEDHTDTANFHKNKLGFNSSPTDFNPRPILVHGEWGDCMGSKTDNEFLLDYLKRVLEYAKDKAPLFAIFWNTGEAHGNIRGLEASDELYAEFLSSLELENTILVVFSDHGIRMGPFTKTVQAQVEGNLPNMWVRLGEAVRKKFPGWEEALKMNENKLLSPFNMYWTLRQVLDSYTGRRNETQSSKRIFPSFFEVKDAASCSDVGVPPEFCPCGQVKFTHGGEDSKLVKMAAEFAVIELNKELEPFPCKMPVLDEVLGSMYFNHGETLLIMFTVVPGKMEVQATVEVRNGRVGKLLNTDRLDKMDQAILLPCKDMLEGRIELFCYCE